MTRYSASGDRALYSLSVIDYSSTNADDKATIAAAEKGFGSSGKVTVASMRASTAPSGAN